jgi:hypothetical protein
VSKTLTKLLDAIEADDEDVGSLKTRIREKDAQVNQLRVRMTELEAKRDALKSEMIEWRQDPTDEEKGEALLQLFPGPGLWDGNQRDSRFVTLSNMAPTTGLEPEKSQKTNIRRDAGLHRFRLRFPRLRQI